jgi:transposase
MFYMYIRLTSSKKSKNQTLQIVEGVREGKKVKQRIIASLGVIKSPKDLQKLRTLADHLIERLEKEGLPPDGKIDVRNLVHKKTVYDGFGKVVNQLMHLSGFSNIIRSAQGKQSFDLEEIVKLVLVQRFDVPSSKLRTCERQEDHGFQGISAQHIYRAMDAVEPLTSEIQKQAFNIANKISEKPIDCFFFDVTTLYFESVVQDELKDFGFSKDQKFHQVQVVLALVVDSQGMPIAYEVFRGNLAETKTLIPVLEGLRSRFLINNVTVVCDRGLASKTNIEVLQNAKFHFVIATKLRSMPKTLKINDLACYSPLPNQELLPENEKILVYTRQHPQYDDALLIATYSPKRAKKDKEDRERLIEKLKKKLSDKSSESSIKKVVSNGGYKKFTNVKKGSELTLNEKAIEEDKKWDGFHGIAVSNSSKLTVDQALARYRDLWRIEEAFRIAKCTLKTRPIYHWSPHRIRSHILLCFMNLFLERYLELILKKNKTPLTTEKIRYALSTVHTMTFADLKSDKTGEMHSTLSDDTVSIFNALGIPPIRLSSLCCV